MMDMTQVNRNDADIGSYEIWQASDHQVKLRYAPSISSLRSVFWSLE